MDWAPSVDRPREEVGGEMPRQQGDAHGVRCGAREGGRHVNIAAAYCVMTHEEYGAMRYAHALALAPWTVCLWLAHIGAVDRVYWCGYNAAYFDGYTERL